jgi:AcrR family transcriptional regulator
MAQENDALAAFHPARASLRWAQADHAIGRRFGGMIGTRYDGIVKAAGDVIARRGFHQASIRDIARTAGLSLAGLYHYVHGKDELLFLVLDRALDRLLAALEAGVAAARSPAGALHALVRTHLAFAFEEPAALRIINRDWELLAGERRREVAAKRAEYLRRGAAILHDLDPHGRTPDELASAINLLLGMLNGIATRPFLPADADVRALAAEVTALFLHGFLAAAPSEEVTP